MRRWVVCTLLLLTLIAGCGKGTPSGASSAPGSSAGAAVAPTASTSGACAKAGTIRFTKAKLLLHAGLAFGAFHRYIYKPYQAGALKAGAPGRTKALLKAGAAALFAVHELRVAARDIAADPTLCHLATPLDSLAASLQSFGDKAKAGQLNPADVTGLEGAVSKLKQQSSQLGAPIQDKTPPSL
jgi:hypothetical protein